MVRGVPEIVGAAFVGGGGSAGGAGGEGAGGGGIGVGGDGAGGAGTDGAAEVTVIEKGASDVLASPSETVITIAVVVPTAFSVGRPETIPVCVSRFAQPGRPTAAKDKRSPSASLTTGWNCQTFPAMTVPVAMPSIVGALLGSSSAGAGTGAAPDS